MAPAAQPGSRTNVLPLRLRNVICASSLLYLLSSIICVRGYDNNPYSANYQTEDLVWGPIVLAIGTAGIIHGWIWFWGVMHRKWTSPLRALLIGAMSMILGFLALGWGLRHTDPVLSGHLHGPFLHAEQSCNHICGGRI
jgi:hypothetical protein